MRTQYIVAAIIPAVIVTLSVTGFVWAQKQVTVVVDGHTSHVATQSRDVAGLLDQAGVTVDQGDIVSPPQSAEVVPGMTVVVRHAVPVTVRIGGNDVHLDVIGATVADALVAAGADPAANTAVSPGIGSPLNPGMTITVPDTFSRVSQEDVLVQFESETFPDPSLPKGSRRVILAGANGLAMRVYRQLVTDGVPGSPVLVAEKVVTPPIKALVAVGTGSFSEPTHQLVAAHIRPALHIGEPGHPDAGRRLSMWATGYSAAEPGAAPNTATGHPAVRGVIAVDPAVIPLGTHLYIPGYGFAIASDTGGMIHGDHIDLCFDTAAECDVWGRRPVTVIILD